MHDCLSMQPLGSNDRSSNALIMNGNWLTDNLVTSTVFVDISDANISFNTFANPVSEFELRAGVRRDGARIEAKNNYWDVADENGAKKKICGGTRDKTLTVADIQPWSRSSPNGQIQDANDGRPNVEPSADLIAPTNLGSAGKPTSATFPSVVDNQPAVAENYISGTGKPYSVAQDLPVSAKSTLTIAPGAVLEFDSDRGLRVQGAIIAKGTEDEPIIFRAALGRTCSGIIFENKNSPTSVLEHCIIDGARIGLFINSDKLAMRRCIVSNSDRNGITLTDESGERVDLGDTTVLNAQDIGLRIANRLKSIDVKNINVDSTGGNGIDFDYPVVNVSSNCRLSNSRRYALHTDQILFNKRTFGLKNCTVINQNGVGGVFLVARDYGLVSIVNTVFSNNNARSLIVNLKCNFTGQPSRFELLESRFENDNDNVVDIHSSYCSNAETSRNTFLSNNRDYRYGVFHLQLDPLKRPSGVGGKVEPADLDEGDWLTLKNVLSTSAIQMNELAPRVRSINADDSLIIFAKAESKYSFPFRSINSLRLLVFMNLIPVVNGGQFDIADAIVSWWFWTTMGVLFLISFVLFIVHLIKKTEDDGIRRRCGDCGSDILVNTKFWKTIDSPHVHDACFKCKDCSKRIEDGGYFLVNRFWHCTACSDQLFRPYCRKCDRPMKDGLLLQQRAGELVHASCCRCSKCKKASEQFFPFEGKPYCGKCYEMKTHCKPGEADSSGESSKADDTIQVKGKGPLYAKARMIVPKKIPFWTGFLNLFKKDKGKKKKVRLEKK